MSNHTEEPSHDTTPEVEVGLEEPPADVLEQHRSDTDQEELEGQGEPTRPLEADAADVEEQRRIVPDHDERRDE